MNITFQNKETEYLLSLLRCAIKNEPAKKANGDIDYKTLFDLAKSHQVYNIILPSLQMLGALTPEEEKIWNDYRFSELQRTIIVNNEREQICDALDKNDVDYMFLKGLVIRDYYPKSFMRQMSDNDILYDETKRDIVLDILKKQGFTLKMWNDNSDDFFKEPFTTIEMHRQLFADEYGFYPDFSFVWQNAKRDSEHKNKMIMLPEDLYLHTVAHIYKHYILGGFGLRFLCDLYLLLTKNNLNFIYVSKRLEDMGITDFELQIRELSVALFETEDAFSESQVELLHNIVGYGIYGSGEVGYKLKYEKFALEHPGRCLKLRYYVNRIFPDMQHMSTVYPALASHKYLLWYYYIVRLCYKLFVSKTNMSNEIKMIGKAAEESKNGDEVK